MKSFLAIKRRYTVKADDLLDFRPSKRRQSVPRRGKGAVWMKRGGGGKEKEGRVSHHHQSASEMCEPYIETADRFLEVDNPIKIPSFTEPVAFFSSQDRLTFTR